MTTLEQYWNPRTLYNGTVRVWYTRNLGLSVEGCPYRGTTVCVKCPFSANSPPALCDWRCVERRVNGSAPKVYCEHRAYCKCGYDQTGTLRAMGLVE